jgi:cell division protein FtsQ
MGRLRLSVLIAALALPALGGGWLWLRDSSLVAVEEVRVSGARGVQAAGIEAALDGAARRMTTLDVNVGELRAAVVSFPVVRDVRVSTSFPHGLRIGIVEEPPVAALVIGGGRTAVAADGVVLGPALLSGRLPLVRGSAADTLAGGRVRTPSALQALGVLGAAPRPLLGWIANVFPGPEGLTVRMRNGLEIYFGDARRPHAKWLSALRVLTDPSSAGAYYVDVRLPGRPAAGLGTGGATTATTSSASATGQSSTTTSLSAALAASLNSAVPKETQTSATAPVPSVSAGTSSAGEPSSEAKGG